MGFIEVLILIIGGFLISYCLLMMVSALMNQRDFPTLRSYVARNSRKIFGLYLLAFAVVNFIPNQAVAAVTVKNISERLPNNYYLIGILALALFLYVLFQPRLSRLWVRYKNTVGAERPSFSYHDYAVWFLASFIVLLTLKQFLTFQAFTAVGVGLGLLSLLLTLLKEEGATAEEARDESWFSDEPIEDEGQDLLRRGPFVQRLYDQIVSLPFADSFVFGFYGSLGEGKTSVLNMLKKKFAGNETHLIVDYDPWNFNDEKGMLPGFYDEVEKAISKSLIVPGFRRTLVKYQKLLSPEVSPLGIKFSFKIEESLEDIKERIENYIVRTKRKLLIIIDDIDRLQPGEILAIFKLVRLNAKFKNTVFILALDRKRVKEKLRSLPGVDDEYIEKFIQKDIPLPATDYKSLEIFLDTHLDKLVAEIGPEEEDKKTFEREFAYLYQTRIRRLFKDLRKTKIYLNSLRASLPPIHREVNLFDFSVLELIKIFYSDVYVDIWQHPEIYVNLGWSDERFLESPFFMEDNEEAKFQRIKEHVESLIKDEPDKEVIRRMLETIFPVHVQAALSKYRSGAGLRAAQTYRTERRITHPEAFVKYFMLDVPTLDIPDEDLSEKLEQWLAVHGEEREKRIAKNFSEFQRQNKLATFLKKLNVFRDKIPKNLLIPIIIAVSKHADNLSHEYGGFEHFFKSEWDKARSLLFTLIEEKLDREEIPKVIEDVVLGTPSIPLAVLTVFYSAREGKQSLYKIKETVNIADLRAKVSERLEGHFVDAGINIFDQYPEGRDWKFIIYQWATNWMTNTGDNRQIVNDYLLTLFEKDTESLIKVLENILSSDNANELKAAYDVERIKTVAERYKDENRLNEEEKAVVENFLAFPLIASATGNEPSDAADSDDDSQDEED